MPGRKPTNKEIRERVEAVKDWLAQGWSKAVIKKTFRERKWGGYRTVDRYMSRATEELVRESDKSQVEWRAELVAATRRILKSAEREQDQLKALQILARLTGSYAPSEHKVETVARSPKDVQDELVGFDRLREQLSLPNPN